MNIFIDVGATNLKIGSSISESEVGKVVIFDTPGNFEDCFQLLRKYVKQNGITRLGSIVVGTPGAIDEENGLISSSRNLPGWEKKPIKKLLEEEFETSVFLKNDADLAGLGEAVFGAGKGHEIVAYLTFSTGVGGARIVKGMIDMNAYGFEPGYQIIDVDSSVDADFLNSKSRYGNNYGYLQRLTSGKDLKERFGKEADKITDRNIWKEVEYYMSAGIANTIRLWSPNIVVLGGGIMKSKYIKIEEVRKHVNNMILVISGLPKITKVKLGDKAGLYGGLHYLESLKNHN